MRVEFPDVYLQAKAARLATIRAKVRHLAWFTTAVMDPTNPHHCDLFNRWHCAIWDACIGPELPAVRSLFRSWPQHTDDDVFAINVRLVELRDRYLKPELKRLCGDMPEAQVIGLFSQSRIRRRYNRPDYSEDEFLTRAREFAQQLLKEQA